MDIANFFWLILLVLALQPVIARRSLQRVRTAKIAAIETVEFGPRPAGPPK